MSKIDVLDWGHVELVDHMGSDLTVVNSARVSFANHKEEFEEKDEKLIRYLAKHNHWTPFAHPQITLRIKAPVSIRTQFFKHKQGFVENEVSRRYVDNPPEFYHPKWRNKPNKAAMDGWNAQVVVTSLVDLQHILFIENMNR
jgi:thymidylate synthase (FAD)